MRAAYDRQGEDNPPRPGAINESAVMDLGGMLIVFTALVALLNARGIKESLRSNIVMTIIEVGGLVHALLQEALHLRVEAHGAVQHAGAGRPARGSSPARRHRTRATPRHPPRRVRRPGPRAGPPPGPAALPLAS